MVEIRCICCGETAKRTKANFKMCLPCGTVHATENQAACAKVGRAVAKGQLPRAATKTCADCGAPATEYDHRDYTRPLDVEPVCRSCNHKRGPALNSKYRGIPA